jgi:hypothetical protein
MAAHRRLDQHRDGLFDQSLYDLETDAAGGTSHNRDLARTGRFKVSFTKAPNMVLEYVLAELISSPLNAIPERVAMQQAPQKIGDSIIEHWQLVSIGRANSSICVVGLRPSICG